MVRWADAPDASGTTRQDLGLKTAAEPAATTAQHQTRDVTRGVCRAFAELGYATLTEFALANGRRADVMALDRNGGAVIVEVKVTVPDFLGDQKWPDYRDYCDRLFFAVPNDFPRKILPAGCGVLVADAYGAETFVEPPTHALHGSRRRVLLLRFARTAAMRLLTHTDPRIGTRPLA